MTHNESYPPCFGTIYFPTAPLYVLICLSYCYTAIARSYTILRLITPISSSSLTIRYTVAIPIQSLNMVYGNLAAELNQEVSLEDKTNVQRIYMLAKYGVSVPGGNGLPPGQAMGDGSFSALMAEATRYIGYPYVWGGSSPDTSFDCSGYICWVYTRSGVYHLSRTTAQGIYDQCASVSQGEAQPGDLVFFTGTYASGSAVSHVGIYVGGGRMLHAGDPIGYADLNAAYWRRHLYGYGRLF